MIADQVKSTLITQIMYREWCSQTKNEFHSTLVITSSCHDISFGFTTQKQPQISPEVLIDLSKERPYLVLDPNLIWTCLSVICCNLAVYNCKLAVYNCILVVYSCKPAVYTCKVLNFRFTTVILITLLDTVEVTPFFQFFLCKAVVYRCYTLWFTLCGLHL